MYDLDRRCPEGCAPKFKDVVLSVKSLHCADEIKLRGVICLQPLQAGKGPRQRGAEGALVSVRPIVSFICGCALKSAAGDASPTPEDIPELVTNACLEFGIRPESPEIPEVIGIYGLRNRRNCPEITIWNL